MNRGMLTSEIEKVAFNLLGIKLTQVGLRLLPYLQYVVMNDKIIDYVKLNDEESDIISEWIERGWIIEGLTTSISISKEFWDVMNEILWIGYGS